MQPHSSCATGSWRRFKGTNAAINVLRSVLMHPAPLTTKTWSRAQPYLLTLWCAAQLRQTKYAKSHLKESQWSTFPCSGKDCGRGCRLTAKVRHRIFTPIRHLALYNCTCPILPILPIGTKARGHSTQRGNAGRIPRARQSGLPARKHVLHTVALSCALLYVRWMSCCNALPSTTRSFNL